MTCPGSQTQAQHGDSVGTKDHCSQMTAAGRQKVRFLLWNKAATLQAGLRLRSS